MKVLASSVVRLTSKGADHGHLYLIDTEKGISREVLKWSDENIDWKGRGGDRGLRGIAFYEDSIIVGSGRQILFLNKNFEVTDIFQNRLLGDIHEIIVDKDSLIITSTLYDLILFLDLKKKKITKGYFIKPCKDWIKKQDLFHRKKEAVKKKLFYWADLKKNINSLFEFFKIDVDSFEPEESEITKSIHMNTVFLLNDMLCFTGTQSNYIFGIRNNKLIKIGVIPYETHNVTPFGENFIMNYTLDGSIVICNRYGFIKKKFEISYDENLVDETYNPEHAKAGWNRGLSYNRDYIIAGTSPATINIVNKNSGEIGIITLDRDVRNSIHGLEILPKQFYD